MDKGSVIAIELTDSEAENLVVRHYISGLEYETSSLGKGRLLEIIIKEMEAKLKDKRENMQRMRNRK